MRICVPIAGHTRRSHIVKRKRISLCTVIAQKVQCFMKHCVEIASYPQSYPQIGKLSTIIRRFVGNFGAARAVRTRKAGQSASSVGDERQNGYYRRSFSARSKVPRRGKRPFNTAKKSKGADGAHVPRRKRNCKIRLRLVSRFVPHGILAEQRNRQRQRDPRALLLCA